MAILFNVEATVVVVIMLFMVDWSVFYELVCIYVQNKRRSEADR